VLDQSEEPHIIAAALTYLYLLDYSDGEQDLVFGVPNVLCGEDAAHAVILWTSKTSRQTQSDSGSEECDRSDACSSEFALDPPGEGDMTPARDPSHRPLPLSLHIQVYKAANRFGIPCLAAHARDKFEKRARTKAITTTELLEAADEVYADGEATFINSTTHFELKQMKQILVRSVRSRWNATKQRSDFENVVLERPEFGRDLMRLL
jgi:hypothetical protein